MEKREFEHYTGENGNGNAEMHEESIYEGHSGIDEDENGDENGDKDQGSSQEDTEESEYGDVQERPLHSTQTLNANRRTSQKEPTSSFN